DTPTPDVFAIGHRQVASRPLAHRGLGSPGRLPPRPRVAAAIPPRWGPLPSAVAAEIIPPASPRRTRKKLSVLLVLMLVAMVVAALVVWKIVLPRVVVQGTIRYDGAANLRGDQRDFLQKNQLELLDDDKVRATAEGLFRTRQPRAAGFFVEQDFRHPQLKRECMRNGALCAVQSTYQASNRTIAV